MEYSCTIHAQLYDKTWVLGRPMGTMTFDDDSVRNGRLLDTTLQSFLTVGNICDKQGNLLFYTNGVNVYNRHAQIMMNGDDLSAPAPYYYQERQGGMSSLQGVLILPKPNDSNMYYIFHYTNTDTLDHGRAGYAPLNFYFSIVDMRGDGGNGIVISKNIPLIQGELLSSSRMSACKHANGRDWWIIKNAWHENLYYEFLLTPNGVQGPFVQWIGPNYGITNEQPSYAIFSPDGNKYASITSISPLVIMDFDRCTGLFSNPIAIYNNTSYDPVLNPISGGFSLAFSKNNRFLYVSNVLELNQYDLLSMHIHDSIRIESLDPMTDFYHMGILQLAPDGKIYVGCHNGGSYRIDVLNHPDSLGSACDFRLYSQLTLMSDPVAIPYFPNFRLEALSGSGCDTVTDIKVLSEARSKFVEVYPNPATNFTAINYSTGSQSTSQAELFDTDGRLRWLKGINNNAGSLPLDLSSFPNGIYFIQFTSNSEVILRTKLVVAK